MKELLDNAKNLFSEIKVDFSSLWHFKERGKTIEFITPYSTLGGEFVSVFLTQRDNGFIVSDGGSLQDVADKQEIELESRSRIHYADLLDKYAVRDTFDETKKKVFHYKVTKDFKMISANVYDLARFYEAVANAIYLETLFTDEVAAESRFKTRVRELLQEKMKRLSTKDNQYVPFSDENTRNYRFTTGICEVNTQRIWLPMSVSRSNLAVFQQSVQKAEYGFNHLRKIMPPNWSFGSIIAPLPDSLKDNPTALRIDEDMKVWKNDFGVVNFSFEQISKITSMSQVFEAA